MSELNPRLKLAIGLSATLVGAYLTYAIYKALTNDKRNKKKTRLDDDHEDTNLEISPPVQFGPKLSTQPSEESDLVERAVVQNILANSSSHDLPLNENPVPPKEPVSQQPSISSLTDVVNCPPTLPEDISQNCSSETSVSLPEKVDLVVSPIVHEVVVPTSVDSTCSTIPQVVDENVSSKSPGSTDTELPIVEEVCPVSIGSTYSAPPIVTEEVVCSTVVETTDKCILKVDEEVVCTKAVSPTSDTELPIVEEICPVTVGSTYNAMPPVNEEATCSKTIESVPHGVRATVCSTVSESVPDTKSPVNEQIVCSVSTPSTYSSMPPVPAEVSSTVVNTGHFASVPPIPEINLVNDTESTTLESIQTVKFSPAQQVIIDLTRETSDDSVTNTGLVESASRKQDLSKSDEDIIVVYDANDKVLSTRKSTFDNGDDDDGKVPHIGNKLTEDETISTSSPNESEQEPVCNANDISTKTVIPDANPNTDYSPSKSQASDDSVNGSTTTTTDSGIGLSNSSHASENPVKIVGDVKQLNGSEKDSVDSSSNTATTINGGDSAPLNTKITHTFLLPATLCGLFIGKSGRNISALKHETDTNIKVGRTPVLSTFRHCTVEGLEKNVKKALEIIGKQYKGVDTTSVDVLMGNPSGPEAITLSTDKMQLHLPMGVLSDVGISHVVSAGHVFVQQPTHPSFNSWQAFNDIINSSYGDGSQAPPLPPTVEDSTLCVAPINNHWYRAQIMSFSEDRLTCEIRLMDVGGYNNVSTESLRQIRWDFLRLPFQAVECYLANIEPVDGLTYTEEATAELSSLTCNQIVQCQPVAVAENNIPFIHLVAVKDQQVVVVNRELANKGLVKWCEL